MGKFHRLLRFFKDKLDRCVWDLIVKNEQPREVRRDGASAAATAASSATNVASSWKQGGNAMMDTIRCTNMTKQQLSP